MDWCRVAILLSVFLAVGSAQRGGRRYVSDQPLEESLSVENHRFRSRSRDASEEIRRGENRRPGGDLSTESSQRLPSGRTRGRTEEPRQYHSISRESASPVVENKQIQSRRNTDPERKRVSAREEIPNERFRSREQVASTEASRGRNSARGRTREEPKEVIGNRRGESSSVTRFPSRAVEDTISQSANHEPIRNRGGQDRRSRTDGSSRNLPSRRNNLQEETRSLRRPAAVQAPTERISGRSSSPEPVIQKTEEVLPKTELINDQQDITGNPDLSAKINAIPESTLAENEEVKTSLDIEPELSEKIKEVNENGSPLKTSNGFDDSKSTLKPAPISTENTIEYPTVNDVEESLRASRKLDSQVTERAQSLRGRSRVLDDSVARRIPEASFRAGENTEGRAGRGRSIEHRGRGRGAEEISRSRNVDSGRRSNVESTARNRNVLDSTRSSGFESTPRSRAQDYTSRGRNADEVPRSSSVDSSRNSRVENAIKSREPEETSRSRHLDNNVRNHAETRGRTSAESRGRSHEEERAKTHTESRGRSRTVERTRSSNDLAGKSDRTRSDSTDTRSRNQDSLSRASEGRRSSHKYSAQIPEPSQVIDEGDKTNNKPSTRTRAKDFANFRSRVKTEDTPQLSKPATPEPSVLSSAPTEAISSVEVAGPSKGDQLTEERNEISVGATTEGAVSSTSKQLGRSLTRKPLLTSANRPRGHVKGPKLVEEKEHSGEVRDDDNYPEVYKQLKKSGTNPKEILVFHPSKK